MQDQNIVTVLPVFKGYTIDSRLKEFRRFKSGSIPEFIKFDSKKGCELISEIAKQKPVPLVSIPAGSSLSGEFLGSLPVDWPLSNVSYGQAALKVKNEAVLITLPQETLKRLRLGQTLTLTSTKQGIETHIMETINRKLRRSK